MNEWIATLWGYKTQALFDVWSIEHVLSGVSVGSAVRKHHRRLFDRILGRGHAIESWHLNVTGVLFLGYAWESVEHYLESGLAGGEVEYWFQGVEMWGNRLVTDPLMLVVGYWIAKKHHSAVWPCRIASLTWLLIHIFALPHSMALQEYL